MNRTLVSVASSVLKSEVAWWKEALLGAKATAGAARRKAVESFIVNSFVSSRCYENNAKIDISQHHLRIFRRHTSDRGLTSPLAASSCSFFHTHHRNPSKRARWWGWCMRVVHIRTVCTGSTAFCNIQYKLWTVFNGLYSYKYHNLYVYRLPY